AARHQIGIDTKYARFLGSQVLKQQITRGERRVEHIHVEPLGAQVRAEIQNAEWSVWLEDLQLLRVAKHEVTVRQKQLGHLHLPHRICDLPDRNELRMIQPGLTLLFQSETRGTFVPADRFEFIDALPETGEPGA